MTNDALKPCPFCGSEKILIYKKFFKVDCPDAEMETHKKVKCDGCGIGTEWYYDTRFGTAEENARNTWNTRAALAPVDVDAGLRALDYQRDLAFIFMVAKGSKDYDETIGDRIERVQELILQLKKQNDYLAARGCFWGWQPIETAPKDGTWIMVYWPTMGIGQYPFVVFWDEGWQPARYSDRDYGEAFPTHWMPLPAAPKKEGV